MYGAMSSEEKPQVTVIVPVFNAGGKVRDLLAALEAQTYPRDGFEVLLVDNGSRDGTRELLQQWVAGTAVRARMLQEEEQRGSYAARNRGLEVAQGEVVAFTDADCTPVPEWLEAGVRCLRGTGADLAGGHVRFTYAGERPSAAELIDSTTNMQMERDIVQRGVTKTANLFVWRALFGKVGQFPSHLQSGGDVWWTQRATGMGFRLVFAREAEVSHPARGWRDLLRKQLRVGYGQLPVMREKGMSWREIMQESMLFKDPRKSASAGGGRGGSGPMPRLAPLRMRLAKMACRLGTLSGRILYLLGHLACLPRRGGAVPGGGVQ